MIVVVVVVIVVMAAVTVQRQYWNSEGGKEGRDRQVVPRSLHRGKVMRGLMVVLGKIETCEVFCLVARLTCEAAILKEHRSPLCCF